eukprot:TRINITY_DN4438_c0_g2_i1.p1 TRINITY_DN4438_c0_g2~~TRINITY_DN4438_c0_g2_i1.p1  ORF type:complete len:799 (-),score=152.09 TRINITY_DN4438_c0_g2_i1:472-2868(-)
MAGSNFNSQRRFDMAASPLNRPLFSFCTYLSCATWQAGSICCPADVCSTQCGGDATTCKAQLGGFYNCCLNGVYSLNRLCAQFAAPCTMPATAAPTTAKPTPKPTARPTTAKPTATPTAAPTTAAPTTAQPTSTPTATPTTATPTAEPTATPTSTPTAAPTTSRPTSTPTAAPTTASPTSTPTAVPTTAAPTTATPTAQPSATPTAVPTTRKPTPVPTVLVVGDPTCSRGTKNLESTVCCLTIACGGKCGGTGCETLAGGYYNCCAAGVLELGRQCSATEAPCALVAAPTPTPTAVTPVVTAAPTTSKPNALPTAPPATAKPSALPTAAPTIAVATAKPTVAVLTAAPTATPTTARVTAAPSAASTGDPTCALGVLNAGKNVCCPKDLCSGQCGGTGCADLPGGSANCCSTTVVAAAKSCATYKAPCVMPPTPAPTPAPTGPQIPDPYCLSGIAHPNGSQCCNNGCIYCGQANCGYDPLGASNCCAAGIINTGRSCDTTSAPCTLDPTPVFEVDYSKIRRSTTVGVLPGPAKNYYQRETAYKVDLDSILMYMPVQRVVYSWVQGYLNKGVQVQLVIEFVDSTANLAMVAAGKYDIYLYSLAKAAVADGRTISVRPLHEFNGDWYPWGIFVPGNTLADYKAAYKHVVDLFRSMNAPFRYQQSYNVANANSDPTKFVDFYAGDDYVDQICVSAYNMVGVRYSKNKSFAEIFGYAYAQLTSFTRKPLCLAEMSTTSYGGDKPQWITNTWSSLAYQFTAVTTVNWFFENKTDPNVDWDLNTQADVSAWVTGLSAFRNSTRPA